MVETIGNPSFLCGDIAAIADDLSGAAEVLGLLGEAGRGDRIALVGSEPGLARCARSAQVRDGQAAHTHAFDLDLRHRPRSEVHARTSKAVAAVAHATVFVKIDSLLRGDPGTMIAAAVAERPLVMCPAVPATGRSTVGGRLRLLRGPTAYEGRDVCHAVGDAAEPVDLRVVRSKRLRASLAAAAGRGIPVCDAETDDDLDRICAAAAEEGLGFVGAGGLAAAVGRLRGVPNDPASRTLRPLAGPAPVLAVVGSSELSAHTQVEEFVARGGLHIEIAPDERDVGRVARRIAEGLDAAVVTVDRSNVDPDRSEAVEHLLGRVVDSVLTDRPDTRLFLSGGQTARHVLDTLGVRTLELGAVIDTGTVHCRSERALDVVTRPGSFGAPGGLSAVVDYLRGEPAPNRIDSTPAGLGGTTEGIA